MSAELFVWDPTIDLHPRSLNFIDKLEQLVMAEPRSRPTQVICDFVSALFLCYPDLTFKPNTKTIWSFGPLLSGANGGFINFAMTMDGYGLGGTFVVKPQAGLVWTFSTHRETKFISMMVASSNFPRIRPDACHLPRL